MEPKYRPFGSSRSAGGPMLCRKNQEFPISRRIAEPTAAVAPSAGRSVPGDEVKTGLPT
jgi:hypothetical protein